MPSRKSFSGAPLRALLCFATYLGCALLPNLASAQSTNAETLTPAAPINPVAPLPASQDPALRMSLQLNPGSAPAPLPTKALPGTPLPEDLPRIATIDLTVPTDDLWQRMRNGFSMPNLESPLVADRQAWYLNRPAAIRIMTQRSKRYLYHIVNELEKRGMPMELALLPMVESAYNPLAASPARALGIWQFIPSTGRNFNLAQNWWQDQRRDIVASTNAALDYLQLIYEMHGDWHLALASYNWGENAVAKAIARNAAKGLPTDYLSLSMPGETRYYVPKLQALKNIIANPELFKIALEPVPNRPYFDAVAVNGPVDVATAAKLAEIPVDEFMALNPGYSRPLLQDGKGNASSLLLPADKVNTFQNNRALYELQDKPMALWHTESLKKGDRLDVIAARSGITLAQLKQINGLTPRNRIGPGSILLLPNSGNSGAEAIVAKMPPTPIAEDKAHSKGKGKSASGRKSREKAGSSRRKDTKSGASASSHKAPGAKPAAGKSTASKHGKKH